MTYLIALVIGVALLLLFRTAKRKPALTATIEMRPSGQSSVTFDPAGPAPDQLITLLLCYGAKLRWLLNNEPPEIAQALREFSAEALDHWAAVGVDDLIHAMPSASAFLDHTADAPSTVAGGERFVVRLYILKDGSAYITNDIPRPGMAVNLAWNYVPLLDAVRSRLTQAQRHDSIYALQTWWDAVFSELGQDKSMAGLRSLNSAASEASRRIEWTIRGDA